VSCRWSSAACARQFNYASVGGSCDVTCKSHRRDEISRSWRDHAGDLCRPGNDPRPIIVQTNRSSATEYRLACDPSNTARLQDETNKQPTNPESVLCRPTYHDSRSMIGYSSSVSQPGLRGPPVKASGPLRGSRGFHRGVGTSKA